MTAVLFVIVPILLDSTSMLPLAVAPMAVMLGGRRPVATTVGFLLGTFLTYTAGGLVLALGLGALLDRIAPALERWWFEPNDVELGVQLAVSGESEESGSSLDLGRGRLAGAVAGGLLAPMTFQPLLEGTARLQSLTQEAAGARRRSALDELDRRAEVRSGSPRPSYGSSHSAASCSISS